MENLKTGDLFIDCSGGGVSNGKSYNRYCIFEFREGNEDGLGFAYNTDGTSYSYYWAHPSEDCRLVNVPTEILFSFKHGSHSFNVDSNLAQDALTPMELIKSSDFHFVEEDEVEIANFIRDQKTIDDVVKNWDKLIEYGVSYKIAQLCFDYIGVEFSPVVNGEIGIHAMFVMETFSSRTTKIKELIDEKIRNGK